MTSLLPTVDRSDATPIGLLAGSGRFPHIFAEAAAAQGLRVVCAGVAGMAEDSLAPVCWKYRSIGISKIGRAIRLFAKHGVREIVMAGKIEKKILFQPGRFWRFVPDWRTLHLLYSYARGDRRDDTLLLAVIREFERDGHRFRSALDFCPELLVTHGFLTRRRPTPAQWNDIRFGWEMAKEMGRLDVGQSVMVFDRAVLAVEAIEGTDECIRRAGTLCRKGGFTVVKVAKPQQDMRFDVPTIGIQTIRTMYESGARCLAVESDRTIVLDQQEVFDAADRLGIAIVALNAEEARLKLSA
jgi:UDP-2,3-diacylglucosamine hydrolase